MDTDPMLRKGFSFSKNVIRAILFVAGGFLFYRKRNKVKTFFKSSNILVALLHGVLLSLIAVIYRLIEALNWIIQQAR